MPSSRAAIVPGDESRLDEVNPERGEADASSRVFD
jgi:hypothetical protein